MEKIDVPMGIFNFMGPSIVIGIDLMHGEYSRGIKTILLVRIMVRPNYFKDSFYECNCLFNGGSLSNLAAVFYANKKQRFGLKMMVQLSLNLLENSFCEKKNTSVLF